MRILHIASFDGNIGDNASHMGFNHMLTNLLNIKYSIEQLEIRKFYNNYSLPDKCRFDDDFTRLANKFDLLFIGGGGFLDFDIKGSVTGTTISLSKPVLDKITIPIIISSVGSNPRNQIPEGNIERFRNFLDYFLNRPKSFLAIRNDGSKKVMKEVIGECYASRITEVLDSGFFYQNDGSFYKPQNIPYILINTTSDQVQMKNRDMGHVDETIYVNEMVNTIKYIIEETDRNIVFAPHIYSDYKAIDELLKHINDFYIRTRITIAPYVQGNFGCNQIFSAYKNSNMVLGMRFHANVCSVAMKVPSIGLAALDRVVKVYESVGLSDNVVPVDQPFFDKLKVKINHRLTQAQEISTPQFENLKQHTLNTYLSFFNQIV